MSSHKKETPRQKMIGMMYLVLTAMLALNVSKDVLNAFSVVNERALTTNEELYNKSQSTYKQFKKELELNQNKVSPFWNKAKIAMESSENLVEYIADLRDEVISKTENIPLDSARNRPIHLLQKKDNYLTPTNILFSPGDKPSGGKATDLKDKLTEYRQQLTDLIDPKYRDQLSFGLQTEDEFKDAFGENQNWEIHYFYEIPLAGIVPILNQFIAEVKSAELEVINILMYEISADDYKYDKVEAKVIPKSNYVFAGDKYISEVIVAAYDTSQSPEIYLKQGIDTLTVDMIDSSDMLATRSGRMYLEFPAEKPGVHKYAGVVSVRNATGQQDYYHFSDQYIVAEPSLTVSATKMNVLYAGVDNPISISVTGIPNKDIIPHISKGKLVQGKTKGSWNARVPSDIRSATIDVSAVINGEKTQLGKQSFRVKHLPNPDPYITKSKESYVSRNELIDAGKITASMPDDFEFDYDFQILSFRMSMQRGFTMYQYNSDSNKLSEEMIQEIRRTNRGQIIIFENIIAQWPDGSRNDLDPLLVTIK